MSTKPYHHGDLRTAMIEKGIEMINNDGVKTLSLRKVATACGVSHAAPYSHFADKEDLLTAIENHIMEKFIAILTEAIKEGGESPKGLLRMGCAYVLFFVQNPQYFSFIFSRSNIYFDFSENTDGYQPFVLYKNFMTKLFDQMAYPKELRVKTMIAHWSMVHGMASIATISGTGTLAEWEERIPDMLSKYYFLGLNPDQLERGSS